MIVIKCTLKKVHLINAVIVWIALRVLVNAPTQVSGYRAPAFISGWYWMDVNVFSSTHVIIEHNLGVYPIKSEVQIRSSTGVIYPGIQTANNDNDNYYPRGGVLCRYNVTNVELIGATNSDICPPDTDGCSVVRPNAHIVYTGASSWRDVNQEAETAAYVRVRLWHPEDFPEASYSRLDINISQSDPFISGIHNLGVIPALTSVQVKLSDGWMLEGQGSDSHPDQNYLHWGGVIYAINGTHFRLWTPSQTGTVKDTRQGVVSFCDGWGNYFVTDCHYTSGRVRVHLWRDFNADLVFNSTELHTIHAGPDSDTSHELFVNDLIDPNTDMVLVNVEAIDGNNTGFHFRGAGAALLDGAENGISGIVYGFTNGSIRVWHPVGSSTCMVRVDSSVGDGHFSQCSSHANIHITVWKRNHFCDPLTPLPKNTRFVSTNTQNVTFECVELSFLTAGDLFLECIDLVWIGTLPTCEHCPPIEPGINVLLDLNYLIQNNSARYSCISNTTFTSGDLQRTCVVDGTHVFWTGSPPVCISEHCPPIEPGINVLLDLNYLIQNNTARYSCISNTSFTSGDLQRTCVVDGTHVFWTGSPPVCLSDIVTTHQPPSSSPSSSPSPSPSSSSSSPPDNSQTDVCLSTNSSSEAEILKAISIAEEMSKNLTVDPRKTTSYMRTLTTATDSRPSSQYIAAVGLFVVVAIFSLIGIADVIGIYYRYSRPPTPNKSKDVSHGHNGSK